MRREGSRSKQLVLRIVLLAALVLVSPLFAAQTARGQGRRPDFAPGRVIVKFKGGDVGPATLSRRLTPKQLAHARPMRHLRAVRLQVDAGDELATAAQLQAMSDVEYAEPDYVARALETPNDTYFSRQWGMTGINAPQAWDVSHGSSGVTVAIVDTGIDGTHPDLSGRVLAGYEFVSDRALSAGANSDDAYEGHGTHVSGIVAASTNNSAGVAGVAWTASLLPVKVLDVNGQGYYSDVADGVEYAADHGAKVINMSLGGTEDSALLKDAVNYAYNVGCLIVAAAGNDGNSQPFYPAAYSSVMAVAATDSSGGVAYYSNYGSYVSVAAPGSSIYSTLPHGVYDYMSGTSMASPHVTGLAALARAVCPQDSSAHVRQVIEDTATALNTSKDVGAGLINAEKAIDSYLSVASGPAVMLADVSSDARAVLVNVGTTTSCGALSWSAALSPGVSWLTLSPSSGTTSGTTPATIRLQASKSGLGYGLYTTQLIVNLGKAKVTIPVRFNYVQQLQRENLPMVVKGASQ